MLRYGIFCFSKIGVVSGWIRCLRVLERISNKEHQMSNHELEMSDKYTLTRRRRGRKVSNQLVKCRAGIIG